MIAQGGACLVHLGGPRGDALSLSRDGGPFAPIAELGWDSEAQTTPQRRLLCDGVSIFVLEPQAGFYLLPPYRVRRLDLKGRETGREEGEGEEAEDGEGRAELHYHAVRERAGLWRVRRCGIDPESGRPTAAEETIPAELTPRERWNNCYGTTLRDGAVRWYTVRERGLFGAAGTSVTRVPCDPGPLQRTPRGPACAGNRRGRPGLFLDGRWRALRGPPLFGFSRPLPGPLLLGRVVLRREGGALPVLEGGPARLPRGVYSGLVEVAGALHAVREDEGPRLEPVEL